MYCTVCSAVFENIAPITVQIKHKIAQKSVQFSIIPISSCAMTGSVADAGTVRETIETVTGIRSIIPAVTGEIHPKS